MTRAPSDVVGSSGADDRDARTHLLTGKELLSERFGERNEGVHIVLSRTVHKKQEAVDWRRRSPPSLSSPARSPLPARFSRSMTAANSSWMETPTNKSPMTGIRFASRSLATSRIVASARARVRRRRPGRGTSSRAEPTRSPMTRMPRSSPVVVPRTGSTSAAGPGRTGRRIARQGQLSHSFAARYSVDPTNVVPSPVTGRPTAEWHRRRRPACLRPDEEVRTALLRLGPLR